MDGKNIFITGGAGKIGQFLIKELLDGGYVPSVLCEGPAPDEIAPGVGLVGGDLLFPETYAGSLENVDTVLHMAAVTHTNDVKKYFDVNAEGTRQLIKSCEAAGVKRFIYISTRAISEDGGSYSVSKLKAESYVRESKLEWVILRPAEVYGISGKEGVDMMLRKIHLMPFVPVVGDGKYSIAPVHISDVISSMMTVIKNPGLEGKTYTIAGPEDLTYIEFIDKVLKHKGLKRAKIHIPVKLSRMLGRIAVSLNKGGRFAMDQISRLLSEKSGDISEARKDLSFDPRKIEEVLAANAEVMEFDRLSPSYENILNSDVKVSGENAEYFANYKAECVRSFLGDDYSGSILDYGCGVGLISKYLETHFDPEKARITGYDISTESIKKAGTKTENVVFTSDINEVGKEKYNAIIVANVLHHIDREERAAFLRKVKSLLADDGYIFIFEHNPYNPATRIIVKLSILDENTSLLRAGESCRLLREAGVDVFQKRYIVFFPKFLK
ncbi:MAG: NAD-dependent epimerase/dehydratase family protein, partial [Candidatus Tantalella remota]|nr:NAD-dependent epimerase/dehydratase family protein [Candidatus Tantalella remota]